MDVLCIDGLLRPGEFDTGWRVKEGERYTVVDEFVSLYENYHCYALLQDPFNIRWGWEADRFIPLSDEDETINLKNKKHEHEPSLIY